MRLTLSLGVYIVGGHPIHCADLESGNNFGFSDNDGLGQNNYFGQGIIGTYDRGSLFHVTKPQQTFHKYSVDWTPTVLTWLVDDVVVRTLFSKDCDNGTHRYPQSPARLQLGLWDGGAPDGNSGTVSWAGGFTDLTKVPYTYYVKSVNVTNYNPAHGYNYTDRSGSWQSIALLKDPKGPSSSASTTERATTMPNKSQSSYVSNAATAASMPVSSGARAPPIATRVAPVSSFGPSQHRSHEV